MVLGRRSSRRRSRYDTVHPLPLPLFGIPDDATDRTRYAVEIPRRGSLPLTHSMDGPILSLDRFPADQRAPVGRDALASPE
jgi:cytochrome bd-type quinol oxidase subunit 1